jgi:hypothetical protein
LHIDDITAALASRDTATVKEAFLALANYPKQDRIAGLSAGNAMIFLEGAAEALRADFSIMPRDTCEALGLAHGASYADGAAAVLRDRQTWASHLGMIFRAQ